MTETALLTGVAVLLDALVGEPRRGHPLVGFGALAAGTEERWNRGSRRRLRGLGAVVVLLSPFAGLAWILAAVPGWTGSVVAVLILFLCLGGRALRRHAEKVAEALNRGDLARARSALSALVARDAEGLDRTALSRATIESVLENGGDAVYGVLFWYLVAGLPGVIVHRLANTLDAMWGYRNQRFTKFGWAAARLDDLLNWPVARFTAMTYALAGEGPAALRCWRRQAPLWKSGNAGATMAAGAGALGVCLGGPAVYGGRRENRPVLGMGRDPVPGDIPRAWLLVRRGLLGWIAITALGGWLLG